MIRTVGVVVPANNEQDDISECLAAIDGSARYAKRAVFHQLDVRVVVVLDRCTDGTAEIVAAHPGVEALVSTAGCVGAARAAGVAHLLASSSTSRREIWLAATDADSIVPLNWLSTMVSEAELGADLVLGTVLPGPGLEVAIRRQWIARHIQGGDHPHVHGANFGIRASAYLALDGWPKLVSGEDEALARRAYACASIRVTRTGLIPVLTSTRLTGRAPRGFSSYLRGLRSMDDGPGAPHLQAV